MSKHENGGYTLVELLVAFALLSVLSLFLLGFVSSGGRLYGSVSSEVNLQMDSQIAMAQLKEYIIDCNEGICFDQTDPSLSYAYVITSAEASGSKEYTLHTFCFEHDSGKLFYGSSDMIPEPAGGAAYSTTAGDLMAGDMTGLSLGFFREEGSRCGAAELTADFYSRGKIYNVSQTIYLRNKPFFAHDLTDLISLIFVP